MSQTPDNSIMMRLRLFDTAIESFRSFGNYENIMTGDISVEAVIKDIKKAFNSTLKEFEIKLTNQKKGEV
jgi:hypothetical protein